MGYWLADARKRARRRGAFPGRSVPEHIRRYEASERIDSIDDFAQEHDDVLIIGECDTHRSLKDGVYMAPALYWPAAAGPMPSLQCYLNVSLPIKNTSRNWPLAVVDVLGKGDFGLYLWGVVTARDEEHRIHKIRSLENACRYFFYNAGIRPDPILVEFRHDVKRLSLLNEPELDERYRGIFQRTL